MINIKNKNGILRLSIDENDKCVYRKVLMEEEYISLSFESDNIIPFAKGDYIDTEFGRFYIVHLSKPKFSKTGAYSYDLKFHADWERWRNRILFYNRQSGFEKSWKMTNRPEIFLDIVIDNISKAGFGNHTYAVDPELTEIKYIEFDNVNIVDGLTTIAEAWGTEWYIKNGIIYLGKCEYGSTIELKAGESISEDIGISDSNSEYCTRLYAFGSDRNLPTNYRKEESDDYVIESVVEKRLKLPKGVPYIDAWANMAAEDVVEGVAVFDDIYPHFIGTIKTITFKTYTETIENEDGTTTVNEWDAYRFTDNSFTFDKDYMIDGQELRLVFQTGYLAGMDFALIFEPEGLKQVFEIVRNDDYGTPLPTDVGEKFIPQVGDKYILYGYDTKFVADNLVEKAEYELYDEALKYIAQKSKLNAVYSCKTNPIRCAGYTENQSGSLIFSNYNIIDLDVGQSVRIKSDNIGTIVSRIRSFEKKLYNKYIANYEIGDDGRYSKTGSMQDEIDTIKRNLDNNQDDDRISLVKLLDTKIPTDNNVFSSLRARKEFLRKDIVDITSQKIIFEDGIQLGKSYSSGEMGGRIDGDGNAELLTMVVRHLLRSAEFRNGFTGEGWQLWVDEWGLSNLEIDRLTVRQIMTVFELLIERIRAVGGQIIVSAANGKVKSVEDTGDAYKVTFEGENYFVAHDLIRCQVFSGLENNGQSPVRGYWVEVQSVEDGKVIIPKTEFAEWSTAPMEGDECVLMGNTENPYRQSLISIAATEDGQPRIDIMDGVSDKNFVGCLRARFGNLDGIGDSNFPLDKQPNGNGLYADNAYLRGTFLLSTGEDIKTKFEVVEGKIESMVEGIRQDFMQDKGFLANPNFYEGMMYWETSNDVVFYKIGSKWIWTNNIISKKNNFALTDFDGERNICRIRNNYIIQKQKDYLSLPEITTNADGQKEPASVYVSFFYKVVTPGTLSIWFTGEDHSGFVDYSPFIVHEELESTNGQYLQYNASGLWNGTGDFCMFFTGEIHVYMMILTTDRLESLKYMYRTLFEQSANLVKISAAVFDQDEQALQETGLVIKPEGGGIYCQDAEGNMALIGAMITKNGKSKIVLQAEDIDIQGSMFLSGYLHKSKTVLTKDNWEQYIYMKFGYYNLDVKKTGTYIIVDKGFPQEYSIVYMPDLRESGTYSQEYADEVRGYVGNTVIIYNNNTSNFAVSGACTEEGTSNGFVSATIMPGEFISLKCVCKPIEGVEHVYWEFNRGTSVQITDDNGSYNPDIPYNPDDSQQ